MTTTTSKMGEREDGTFAILSLRLEELMHRVGMLNRRAVRTGGQALAVEIVREEMHPVTRNGRPAVKPVTVVRIAGSVPVISGHTFVAKITHCGEAGNIIAHAPGSEGEALPISYRNCAPECEHCKTNRRRNDTFVLRAAGGELVQIGRNCLADYLRTEDAIVALRMFGLLEAIRGLLVGGEDDEHASGGYDYPDSTTHYLACVVSSIRRDGWVPLSAARDGDGRKATTDLAQRLCGPIPDHPDLRKDWLEGQPNESDYAEAAAVIEWAASLGERADLSEYHHNLRVATASGWVRKRTYGLVASAVAAMRRETEAKLAADRRPDRGPGQHVGAVGKRVAFDALTVLRVRYSEGTYGTTTIVALEDPEGNELTWFASGTKDFKPGDRLTGKGTVKAHGEYQGRKTTTITRCALSPA